MLRTCVYMPVHRAARGVCMVNRDYVSIVAAHFTYSVHTCEKIQRIYLPDQNALRAATCPSSLALRTSRAAPSRRLT